MPNATGTQARELAAAEATIGRMRRVMVLLNHQPGKFGREGLAIMQKNWLTYPQVVSLFALRTAGALAVSELAGQLNLSRAATSHLVDRLVQKKLVARAEDAGDRRYKRVTLTARGRTLTERLNRSRLEEFCRLITALPTDYRARLDAMLTELVAYLENGGAGASSGRQP